MYVHNSKYLINTFLNRAAGSRWVTGIWWFFALIITASYTANMSTFLSASRRNNEITDVSDLADQNAISYGALYNGSTYKFFEVKFPLLSFLIINLYILHKK